MQSHQSIKSHPFRDEVGGGLVDSGQVLHHELGGLGLAGTTLTTGRKEVCKKFQSAQQRHLLKNHMGTLFNIPPDDQGQF